MREEIKENIKLSMQRIVPFLLSLMFILFNYIPANIGIPNIIRPEMGLLCVFYWVLCRPDLFNMFMVFFLGLVSDVMSASPIGTNIISYLTMYLIVSNLSKFFNNKPYSIIWYGFAFVLIFVDFVKWLLVSVYYAKFLPLGNLFFTILFTIACYPVICFLNNLLRKYLMNDEG